MSWPLPLQLLVLLLVGWVSRRQQAVIEYYRVENAVLREQLGRRRLRFTDAQRRRLARVGRALGREALRRVGTLVTPDTILRWYRELVARKYDGSRARGGARSPTGRRLRVALADLVVRLAEENPGFGYTRLRTR